MRNWERSFPAAQLQDHTWMIDVLEDLANYCEYHELDVEGLEVGKTLSRISNHQNSRCSNRKRLAIV